MTAHEAERQLIVALAALRLIARRDAGKGTVRPKAIANHALREIASMRQEAFKA